MKQVKQISVRWVMKTGIWLSYSKNTTTLNFAMKYILSRMWRQKHHQQMLLILFWLQHVESFYYQKPSLSISIKGCVFKVLTSISISQSIGKTLVRIILWCPTIKMLIKACFLIQPPEQEGRCQKCCMSLCSKVFINYFYQMKASPECLNILIYWSNIG